MANMNFGVNILPKANNTYSLGNSNYKWANIFTNTINGTNTEEIIASANAGIITPTFTATSGYYISNTGVKSSSSNYSMSSPIPMSEGDIISLIAIGYSTSVAMISLSNEEGTSFTPVVNSIDSNEHEYIYHVVNDGYYIISYKSSNATYTLTQYTKDSFYAVKERVKTIEDLNLQGLMDNEKYNPLYTNITATMSDNGHFIQKNATYQSASAFNISSTITLPANSIIVFNAQGYQDNVAILAQVKDNTYIPLIISEDSNEHMFSYITYDQINVLISSNKAVTPIYSIYSSRIDTLDGRVNNIESDLFAFTTMGVIGDSLANGSSNYSDGISDNPNYSWGRCIERIYGTEVILFTKGGFTTQDWLTDPAGLPALQSEKALDCYVIGLGQNDAYSLGDAYLGTVSDISVGDESNNADSYYGNYSKIIAAIQTKSPNAKIFCLTNARPNSQTKLNYNSAIEDIVELYDNTYLVDLAADPFYSSSIFNDTWYGAHSTPAGYRLIAKNIHDNICKIIRQNIADFTDISTWVNTTPLSLHSLKNSIDTLSASALNDVQINGTSILNNHIATIPIATTSNIGLMSAADKIKLNNITPITSELIEEFFTPTELGESTKLDNKTFHLNDTLQYIEGLTKYNNIGINGTGVITINNIDYDSLVINIEDWGDHYSILITIQNDDDYLTIYDSDNDGWANQIYKTITFNTIDYDPIISDNVYRFLYFNSIQTDVLTSDELMHFQVELENILNKKADSSQISSLISRITDEKINDIINDQIIINKTFEFNTTLSLPSDEIVVSYPEINICQVDYTEEIYNGIKISEHDGGIYLLKVHYDDPTESLKIYDFQTGWEESYYKILKFFDPWEDVSPYITINVGDWDELIQYVLNNSNLYIPSNIKDRLDSKGLYKVWTQIRNELNTKVNYNTIATTTTAGLMTTTDKIKLDGITTMTGATSSAAGAGGLVPAPATTDVNKFLAGDGTYKSGGLPMVILSYGSSTWAEFEAAYNNNVIVYCRASSNSNPATGSQTRMAFMAYVNNATTPTEVEFQYYRSMSSHSSTAMGDQVFVYKLTKTGGWSVTTRDASIKQIKAGASGNLSVSWSSNVVTIDGGLPAVTSTDNGKILSVVNGSWSAVTMQQWQGGSY